MTFFSIFSQSMETCYVCLEPMSTYTETTCCKIRLHTDCYHELLEYGFKCPFHRVERPRPKPPHVPDTMFGVIVQSLLMCIPLALIILAVYLEIWARSALQTIRRRV